MYLSKVTLNTTLQARQALVKLQGNSLYAAHQLLWQLFTQYQRRCFLFRESYISSSRPEFLLLSAEPPVDENSLFALQIKPYRPKLKSGDRLAFQLRVNPTLTVKTTQGVKQRHDVLMHAKYQLKNRQDIATSDIRLAMEQAAQAWLADARRLERWGIRLASTPDVLAYQQHRLRKAKKQQPVTFSSVDYQGLLTVQDPQRFIETIAAGVGKAKAFGCGLILIRPV
jgi:CRISPR system Cascade subunit CasE